MKKPRRKRVIKNRTFCRRRKNLENSGKKYFPAGRLATLSICLRKRLSFFFFFNFVCLTDSPRLIREHDYSSTRRIEMENETFLFVLSHEHVCVVEPENAFFNLFFIALQATTFFHSYYYYSFFFFPQTHRPLFLLLLSCGRT